MSDCLIVGDVFEQEDWFRVFFIQPPNGEDLHARGLIEYTWGLPIPPGVGQLNQYELVDNDRETHYIYSKVMADGDPDADTFTINVKARDMRFESLDISDTEEEQVDIELPCVILGNSPNFSIADAHIYEPESGQSSMVFTITASEAVIGLPITVDYCTEDVTASSTSETVEVKHVAYDKNVPPEPFISYLDFGNVRAVFDASFPKFYNTRYADPDYSNAWELLTNFIGWLNTRGGTKVLFMGDREDEADYQIKDGPNTGAGGTTSSGFYNSIRPHIEGLGYTVDTLFKSEIGATPGEPSVSEILYYDVIVYLSSAVATVGDQVLSNKMVNSIESAVRQGVGILIVTDHMTGDPASGFAVGGNQIANRFYAEFSGSINRSVGTDFDEVRTTYGDHPLIAGVTGTMPGDGSEGKIETNNAVLIADYEQTCGTVTFNAGQASRTISVPVNADTSDEDVETFKMNISNATRGAITKATGIGTIDLPPTIITELVSENTSIREIYVAKDTSGSTSAAEVTVNGNTGPTITRRFLMDQIILDYDLATDNDPSWDYTTGQHGLDRFIDNPPIYNHMSGAATPVVVAELAAIIDAINSDTSLTDASILVMNDSSDDTVIRSENYWSDGTIPNIRPGVNIELTIIRIANISNNASANFLNSERNFIKLLEDFRNLDSTRFNADDTLPTNSGQFWNTPVDMPTGSDYFQTFQEYTTGADTLLNRMLNRATLDEYTAYCNVQGVGNSISVYAYTPEEAQSLAEAQLTCP